MRRHLAWLLGLCACAGEPAPAPAGGTPFGSDTSDAPVLWGEGPRASGRRKLSVDELRASVSVAAGVDENGEPIRWLVDGEDALSDDKLGKVLGRPDYVAVTAEPELPSALYVKFVRDMARDVCNRMVQADLARSGEPSLWRHAPYAAPPSDAELDRNLQYLALRFLGVALEVDDPLIVALRDVYRASEQSYQSGPLTPQIEGWRGVCIALFEEPAFHLH